MIFDGRRDDPDNLIDAGLRGLAKLRDLVTQIADPTASPRPRPLATSRRPPRQANRPLAANGAGAREPATDVYDEGNLIRVVADMPGVEPDSTIVTGAGSHLTIAAQGANRRYERTLRLPRPVHVDGVTPTLVNGIMEVLLPVDDEARVSPPPTLPRRDESVE